MIEELWDYNISLSTALFRDIFEDTDDNDLNFSLDTLTASQAYILIESYFKRKVIVEHLLLNFI